MLVLTPTTTKNIENIKTALETSNAVLIQGEIGCGKSLMVDYLANLFGCKDTLIQVDVDDSFDSKDLLGKFSATETPGSFEWLPGPLTLAVENGYWLLMEDIDLASFDVFSVILSLLENSTLFISDKNKIITAHPNFKLIATQQIVVSGDALFSKKNSIPYLELWGSVIMSRIPPQERCDIVHQLYDKVPLSVLESLTTLSDNSASPNVVNLRTLLRWGKRVNRRLETTYQNAPLNSNFLSSTLREMMLREAFDCFVARFPPGTEQQTMLNLIANACGVAINVAETLVIENKPQHTVGMNGCTFGRINLPLYSLSRITRQSRIAFAETRQAMSLLERLAAAVESKEHVLLTGETGVGKTFVVQYLADQLGQNLIVHNLNQQTDTSDFMGGWKPLDLGITMRELFNNFTDLFGKSFNVEKNAEFLNAIQNAFSNRNWERTARLIQKGCSSFIQKREKQEVSDDLESAWTDLRVRVDDALNTILQTSSNMAFFFEEGSLVKAWREGHWILLDELNLATTEVLERVSTVLGDVDKLFLTDKGSSEAIPRHKNFHVFANMNPPTDVGKKDLPPSLRSRFTECFVNEPFNPSDINIIVREYIGFLTPDAKIHEITEFFLDCVANAKSKLCALDGESKPPSFSMRTLTRALSYVRKATPLYGFNGSLFDGLLLGFATPLQRQFHKVVEGLIVKNIFKGKQPPTPHLPAAPSDGEYIPYEHMWIKAGSQPPFKDESFILTDSVKGHLTNLSRAVFAQRPVLLEGPTSSGKSSMVKYLAELTGNTFVRINNHESTEVQEYLGHYVTDEYGKLRFVDGILVNAVRNGYWVVLDELNLAPTDVLEALNRLLDDNCELFIPDTQETIHPHPDLRIFATQNPAGIYGGRKMLSRAFRNRFLEITVDEIPTDEIVTILRRRYSMPEGFAVKIVEVMTNLQLRRQSSQIFAGRHGFITPRDLFRWAERKPSTYQELAEHGFLLLGERCRKAAERQIVKDVIESVTKTELSESDLYKPSHWPFVEKYYNLIEEGNIDEFKIVWTESMQRLFTVVGICLEHFEPVLLVGETGSSKTTVCQLWAALLGVPLRIVNCHQHTEAADFLGSLRPVPPDRRDHALFEWRDGPLVESMRHGDFFLLDEISLTEDSVLERLNSVLEPSRSITLAEKSSGETFTAHERFRVLATMNPGGDFGKKELSPALRNRFTEIYVRPTTEETEVATILSKRLHPELEGWALKMARVLCGLSTALPSSGAPTHISIRDIISWVEFMNAVQGRCVEEVGFAHGLDALLLDGIGVGSGQLEGTTEMLKRACVEQAEKAMGGGLTALLNHQQPFWELLEGMEEPTLPEHLQSRFFFGAPTTRRNLSKLMRSTVLRKAVLLEGSPGVGKTSIVEALGAALGIRVIRINLSEQTDIMDLFGSFLPQPSSDENEEAKGPQFAWSDGILLQALKEGSWAILDELNLASQSVLEGLNALLDHRAAVFIPELNEEFHAHPNFRVFACQNPLAEGGGRKGLPRSFLNRFVKVRVEAFSREDLVLITEAVCPDISRKTLAAMVDFVAELQLETMIKRSFGLRGSPWEFNLRDVLRWAGLMRRYDERERPMAFADALFVQRFRAEEDRRQCQRLLLQYFPHEETASLGVLSSDFLLAGNAVVYQGRRLLERHSSLGPNAEFSSLDEEDEEYAKDGGRMLVVAQQSGDVAVSRKSNADDETTEADRSVVRLFSSSHHDRPLLLLPSQADTIAALLMCAAHQQFAMLIGTSGSGKTFVLRTAAALAGAKLVTFSINASCDTIDLLGGFDQVEGKQGQFEWRDSLILEAMLQGHWLVLDNVNYCNASVLDRLNPLVEPNGVLSVNEQGLVNGETRVIRPHPNFRLFATMNPRYGEISRAMRNRAVELCVSPVPVPSVEGHVLCCGSSLLPGTENRGRPSDEMVDPTGSFSSSSSLPDMDHQEATLRHLTAFHHLFVQHAFHADTQATLSAGLSDATSAGAPNIFTLLRASSMLKSEVTAAAASFQKALLHCYVDNRVGSWLHQKEFLLQVLRYHVDLILQRQQMQSGVKVEANAEEKESLAEMVKHVALEEAKDDADPRLQDAIRAFTLGSPSLLTAHPQANHFISHRLTVNRVTRSGLALLKAVYAGPVKYNLQDLLSTFVLEQVTDGVVSDELTAARRDFIGQMGLPEDQCMTVLSLLDSRYCSPNVLHALFCQTMALQGPHATTLSVVRGAGAGGSALPISDSPAVNNAATRLLALMDQCLAALDDPHTFQALVRVLAPFVMCLGGTPDGHLSPDNFVPVVTKSILLLDFLQEKRKDDDPMVSGATATGWSASREMVLQFLDAVRRHLDIPFPLCGAPPLLESLVPAVHIATEEERRVVEHYQLVQRERAEDDRKRVSDGGARGAMYPLWLVAAFRAEFTLLQSLIRLMETNGPVDGKQELSSASSLLGAKQLVSGISSFIRQFTEMMPLYTALDLTLWASVRDALMPATGEMPSSRKIGNMRHVDHLERPIVMMEDVKEDVRRYVPLLVTGLFQRFGLKDMNHLFFGSWSSAASRCIRFASDVPVGSIGVPRNEHQEALSALSTFLALCRRAPRDPFQLWRVNMHQELLQVLAICVPATQPLCVEALHAPESLYGPLLGRIEDMLKLTHPAPTAAQEEVNEMGIKLPTAERALLQLLVSTLREAHREHGTSRAATPLAFPLRAVALLCALKCRLLLPSSPIDPMYRRALQVEIAKSEGERWIHFSDAGVWSAKLSQRAPAALPHLAIVEALQKEEEERWHAAADGLSERPDPTGRRFAALTRELYRICSTFLSEDRLRHIITVEEQTTLDTWGELLFQETTSLLVAYGGYEDATLNMAQSALFAAVTSQGLPLERRDGHDATHEEKSTSHKDRTSLLDLPSTLTQLQFPFGVGAPVPLPTQPIAHVPRRLQYLDACLTMLKGAIPQTIDPQFISGLFRAYRKLYRHVEEQNRKDKLAEEMLVKYKEKSLLIEGDDEKMLQKLHSLFPSYEKEFVLTEEEEEEQEGAEEHGEKAGGSPVEEGGRVGHQSRVLFAEKDGVYVRRMAEAFTEVYHRLVDGRLDRHWYSLDLQLQSYKSRFDALASELVDAQKHSPHASLVVSTSSSSSPTLTFDENEECLLLNGFSARAAILRAEFTTAASTVEEKNTTGFNIFRDPEPGEVRRFSAPLSRLLQRIEALLETYPENVTLQLCRRLALKISRLSALKTPLMKIMTGCEVLLRQCYEWERNAASTVSLMVQMTELSSFVLRWRRLELHCWGHVFKAKREEFELHASLQWFQLYDVAHRGTETESGVAEDENGEGEGSEDDEVAHCMRLFQRLSQYMWASSLGDFSARLRVARGVAFELVASSGLTAPRANVALHVVDFFSQFEAFVSDKCAAAVRPLEEDMMEFCQIMRWEDANYYAVRATVEKSHLKVARVLSALEDALRTPVLPMLVAEEERCEEDPAMGFPLPPEDEDVDDDDEKAKKKKKNAAKKAAKAAELAAKAAGKKRRRNGKPVGATEALSAVPSIDATAIVVLWEPFAKAMTFFNDGANEIISNVASLQAPKTPQQMKIRALKMMFERLASCGIPCTHEQQVENWEVLYSSTEALLGCRTAFSHQVGAERVPMVSEKQYRFCRWVQRMREAERHPHQDLSGAQVKRSTGTVESILAHLVLLSRWSFQLFELEEELTALDQCVSAAATSTQSHTNNHQSSASKHSADGGQDGVGHHSKEMVSTSLLDNCLELVAALRGATESFQWMQQQQLGGSVASTHPAEANNAIQSPSGSGSAGYSTEDRALLMELQTETDRLWRLCCENETLRRLSSGIPFALAAPFFQQLERLQGVCGRLQRHSDPVVRAAAALCEQRVATPLQAHESERWAMTHAEEDGRPVGPRTRLRTEPEDEDEDEETDAGADSHPSRTAADLLRSVQRLCDVLEVPLAISSPVTKNADTAPLTPDAEGKTNESTEGENVEETEPEVSSEGVYSQYMEHLRMLQNTTEEELQVSAQLLRALRRQKSKKQAAAPHYPSEDNVWLYALSASDARSAHLLLQRARSVVKEAKLGALQTMDSHAHFGVVLSRLVTVLMKKGFCKTEEQEEQDGEGDGEGGQQGGTGMDDGEGEKDVTNEMENEDQLMNMKDKEPQEQQDKGEKEDDGEEDEDNAADVETDFAGQKENREESENEDEEDGDGSDQEMGEVEEEDEVQERKKSRRDKNDTDSLNEDDGEQAEEVPQDEFEDHEQGADDEETGGFENKEEEIRDANEEAEKNAEENREMVADDEKGGLEDESEDDADAVSSSGDSSAGSAGEEEDKQEEATDEDLSVDDDEEADSNRDGSEGRDKEDKTDSDEDRESRDGEQEVELSDAEVNSDEDADENGDEDAADENVFEGGQQDDRTGEEATENKEQQHQQQQHDDAAGTDEQQAGEEQEQDDAGRNWKQQQEQNAQSQRKDNTERNRSEKSNPYKAMKEALQRHQRQAPQQLNLSQQVEVPKDKDADKKEPKEKKPDGQPDDKEEEEAVDHFEFDEEGEAEGMAAADDFVPPTASPEEETDNEEESHRGSDDDDAGANEDDDDGQDTRQKRKPQDHLTEVKDEEEEEGQRKKSRKGGKPTAKPVKNEDEDEDDESDADAKREDPEEEGIDEKLSRGRRRWQEHEAAVQGLAQQLCEQLRLILAPTLADKLQGDYKSGKRLNMKRIIPYIASQFKKDRIWLRRTKPNKRTYQIMVALDDSLSMQCNEAGEFSCRAVTLMAKALQQLEVGEMAIACFGEDTNILHPLEEPFTAESGPRVFSEINFAQNSTKLGRFLENTLSYLDDARERLYGQTRSTTQELQQLLYIFSDGQITENRADIRKLMVRAEENHQMVIFVILDLKAEEGSTSVIGTPGAGGSAPGVKAGSGPSSGKPPLTAKDLKGLSTAERLRRLKADRESRLNRVQSRSILDMQLVEFKGGNVIRKGYMEDFPFPYYLIVRELDRLPEIIADSMRQWFELLNGH